jgi:hypothetical protein
MSRDGDSDKFCELEQNLKPTFSFNFAASAVTSIQLLQLWMEKVLIKLKYLPSVLGIEAV